MSGLKTKSGENNGYVIPSTACERQINQILTTSLRGVCFKQGRFDDRLIDHIRQAISAEQKRITNL
jgi:hypothetical protein